MKSLEVLFFVSFEGCLAGHLERQKSSPYGEEEV